MRRIRDLSGQRFGRLVALRLVGENKHHAKRWLCACDCGQEVEVSSCSLLHGHTKSCGCWRREIARERARERVGELHWKNTTHGDSRHSAVARLYRVWYNMKGRCYNSKNHKYKYYQNITVCDEWLYSYLTFKAWALANDYQEGFQIDRIDSTKGYFPNNCQFLSRAEHAKKTWADKKKKA